MHILYRHQIFENIKFGKLTLPNNISDDCKSLIQALLQKNPDLRLGSKHDAEEIKKHKFFYDINWDLII